MTVDLPGAFMQAGMDELIHVCLEGPLAEMLVRRIDQSKYQTDVVIENQKKVLYVVQKNFLYGTVQAALLFWEDLSRFLIEELGFTMNPYNRCVVNKIIKGKQCTIIWHVDDLKLSHMRQSMLEDITKKLSAK
jgi:hypothetical protein